MKNFRCAVLALAVAALSYPANVFSEWAGTIRTTEREKVRWYDMAKISPENALSRARELRKGNPLELTLDDEHGFLVYEITVLDANGVETDIILDAGTGEVLHSKLDD